MRPTDHPRSVVSHPVMPEHIGTLTVTGKVPIELDGLFLGYTERIKLVFKIRLDGTFERCGMHYKTVSANDLIVALDMIEGTSSACYNKFKAFMRRCGALRGARA